MKLFPYQIETIQNFMDHDASGDPKVPLIALATGAGKGRVAVEIMSGLVDQNPKERFLVLPHAQTNLRSNFVKEIKKWVKPNLKFLEISPDSEPTPAQIAEANVVVCLPQTARNLLPYLGNFTRILVDEAHERYAKDNENKKEYTQIRQGLPKAKEILLTASHGEFKNSHYKKFTVSLLEAYSHGTVSDVSLVGVNTKWDFTVKDFNQSGEIVKEVNITPQKVVEALHDLVLEMDSWRGIGSNNKTTRAIKGSFVKAIKRLSGDFPKTVIATRNIDMAEQVYKFFIEQNGLAGQVIMSHSKNDDDRLLEFNGNDKLKVLIVVNRANLGFDAENVMCVVDMTGTTNENRMMQLIGRAARVRRDSKGQPIKDEKAYFKVMPQNMEMYTRALLQLSALLTIKRYYADYEGRQPLKKQITVARKKNAIAQFNGTRPKKENDGIYIPVPNRLSDLIVGADQFFTEYARTHGEYLEVFTKTSLSEVKNSKVVGDVGLTPKEIIEYAENKFGRTVS